MEDKNVSSTVWFPKLQQVSRNKANEQNTSSLPLKCLECAAVNFRFQFLFLLDLLYEDSLLTSFLSIKIRVSVSVDRQTEPECYIQ